MDLNYNATEEPASKTLEGYDSPIAKTGEQQFACVLKNRSGVSAGEIDFGARFIDALSDGDQQDAIEAAYSIYLKWCRETGKKSKRDMSSGEAAALRYTADGELAECPKCRSIDVGGVGGSCSNQTAVAIIKCYSCSLELRKIGTLKEACQHWNTRAARPHPAPSVQDSEVLRNSIVEILKETYCNKKAWWVLQQLGDALNTQRVHPAILEKVEKFRLEWDQPHGVVLVWDSEPYGWKNELRNPESERPGALAIDADLNQWEAQGGDESSGAERWVLCCNNKSAQEDAPSDQH